MNYIVEGNEYLNNTYFKELWKYMERTVKYRTYWGNDVVLNSRKCNIQSSDRNPGIDCLEMRAKFGRCGCEELNGQRRNF